MPHHQVRDAPDRGVLKGTEEVPATAPIFEGHLYLQHPEKKNRWQWRLFRFDGTSFTCLSTQKIKLPPDTPVDAANDDNFVVSSAPQPHINSSPSFNTSHTSPLLATPKDKSLRLVSLASSMPDLQTIDRVEEAPVVMASYYQLPKWTVDISNISAISVLKQQPKKRSPFSTSTSSKPKSFCVRTFDGQCYVMKAQKHKDLERWLFVLTKMWKFAQTIRNQLQQQQKKTTPVPVQPSPSYRPSSRHIWEPAPETMHRPVVDANSNMMMRNLVPPPPPHQEMARPSPYDNRYKAPMLSMEKVQWIDQWRESLAELAAYDTSPPPIEPIPDDDKMSTISGLTSISLREKSAATRKGVMPRRKPSKRSIRSVASALKRNNNDAGTTKSNSIAPADASSAAILPQELPLEDRPSTSLKKKRSDEVKNWISNNTAAAQAAPDIDFFQDAKTILDGDGTPPDPTVDRSVRYHSSIRGRNIKVIEEEVHPAASTSKKKLAHRSSMIADDQIHATSPLQTLAKADSTHALQLQLDHAKRSSSPALLWQPVTTEEDEDENMSLADLQRTLRKINMNENSHHRARSPSASSVLDRRIPPLDLQHPPNPPPHHYLSATYVPHPPTVAAPPPIVAPAVPPVPIVTGGGAPSLIHPPPPPRGYYAQPAISSSDLTSKTMYRHHDPQSDKHTMEYVKKRPQSWMIPSSTSSSTLMEKQKHLMMAMKNVNNGSTVSVEHPTRRSVDILDTRRSGNSSRW